MLLGLALFLTSPLGAGELLPPSSPPLRPEAHLALRTVESSREAARRVLVRHCGACHLPDSVPPHPKALAIFNLKETEFAARMSELQLQHALGRLRDRKTMTEAELREVVPHDFPAASRPTKEEVRSFERFVGMELESRILSHPAGK